MLYTGYIFTISFIIKDYLTTLNFDLCLNLIAGYLKNLFGTRILNLH